MGLWRRRHRRRDHRRGLSSPTWSGDQRRVPALFADRGTFVRIDGGVFGDGDTEVSISADGYALVEVSGGTFDGRWDIDNGATLKVYGDDIQKTYLSSPPAELLYGTLCNGERLRVETRLMRGSSLEIVDCSEYQPIVFQDCDEGDMVRDFTQDIQNHVRMLMLLNPYWSFPFFSLNFPPLVPNSQSNSAP